MKETRSWLALSAIAVIAVILVSFSPKETSTVQDSTNDTDGVVAHPEAFETSARIDLMEQPLIDQIGEVQNEVARPSSFEANLVVGNAVDMSFLEEMKGLGAPFQLLTEEFRNSSDPKAIAAGNHFRKLFLTQDRVPNGSVVVESLECGVSLCAVEFRALNEDELNLYAKDVLTSPEFKGGIVFQPYVDSGELPDSYRQYIFAHDPELQRMSFADGSTLVDLSHGDSESVRVSPNAAQR